MHKEKKTKKETGVLKTVHWKENRKNYPLISKDMVFLSCGFWIYPQLFIDSRFEFKAMLSVLLRNSAHFLFLFFSIFETRNVAKSRTPFDLNTFTTSRSGLGTLTFYTVFKF